MRQATWTDLEACSSHATESIIYERANYLCAHVAQSALQDSRSPVVCGTHGIEFVSSPNVGKRA